MFGLLRSPWGRLCTDTDQRERKKMFSSRDVSGARVLVGSGRLSNILSVHKCKSCPVTLFFLLLFLLSVCGGFILFNHHPRPVSWQSVRAKQTIDEVYIKERKESGQCRVCEREPCVSILNGFLHPSRNANVLSAWLNFVPPFFDCTKSYSSSSKVDSRPSPSNTKGTNKNKWKREKKRKCPPLWITKHVVVV